MFKVGDIVETVDSAQVLPGSRGVVVECVPNSDGTDRIWVKIDKPGLFFGKRLRFHPCKLRMLVCASLACMDDPREYLAAITGE